MSEIYAMLVLEAGLSPEYVLDEMQLYEVRTLLSKWNLIHRESWEQTRWQTCLIMNMLSKDKIKVTDLIQFPWDDNYDTTKKDNNSQEHMTNLIERARQFEKNFNNE